MSELVQDDLLERTLEEAARAGCPIRWAAWNLPNPNTEVGRAAHIRFYQWWVDPFRFPVFKDPMNCTPEPEGEEK